MKKPSRNASRFALLLSIILSIITLRIASARPITKAEYKLLKQKASSACDLIRSEGVECQPDSLLALLGNMYGGIEKIPLSAFEAENVFNGLPTPQAYDSRNSERKRALILSEAGPEVSFDSAVVTPPSNHPSAPSATPDPNATSFPIDISDSITGSPTNSETESTTQSPEPIPSPICKSDMIVCQEGTAYDCCNPNTQACVHKKITILGIGGDYAMCHPKEKGSCTDLAKPNFCPNGGGQAGGTCCPIGADCGQGPGGIAFCSYKNKVSNCSDSSNTLCPTNIGIFASTTLCCPKPEICKQLVNPPGPAIVQACSATECKVGQTLCVGKFGMAVCCDDATTYCHGSTDGNPSCVKKDNTQLVSEGD